MKKCSISILSSIFAGLLILSACDNPLANQPDSAEPSAPNPASSESCGAISARIFLPDYHKLATQQARVIAPRTEKVRLSIRSGTATITWTQHGEDLVIDWDNLESVEGAPAELPGGIWTAQFLALESSVYAPGTLRIELLDADNQVITRGYNEEAVVIAINGTASVQFFTIPVVLESNAGSLEQGEMRFWRIYQKASSSTLTLIADGSWPDIVLFNTNGTFRSYHSISGPENSAISLPAVESATHYYIGVWADAGAVTSYNLELADDLVYTISSITDVQTYLSAASGGATAADPVYLDVQLNLADTSNGWTDLLDAIQTAGKFVALNLSASTISGTEYDPGTANTGESKIVSLVMPDAATSIKAGSSSASTFSNFTALTSVSGSAVETIGSDAFAFCDALTTVSLPAATSIGDYAFYWCTALTEVSLPAATDIGDYAFSRAGTSGLIVTLGSHGPHAGSLDIL